MRMLQLQGYDDTTAPTQTAIVDVAPITLGELFAVSVVAGVTTWAITRVLDSMFSKRGKR